MYFRLTRNFFMFIFGFSVALHAQQTTEIKIDAAATSMAKKAQFNIINSSSRPMFVRITYNTMTKEQTAQPNAGNIWAIGSRKSGKPVFLNVGENFLSEELAFPENLPIRITYSFVDGEVDKNGKPIEYSIDIIRSIDIFKKVSKLDDGSKWPFPAQVYKVIQIDDILKNYLPEYSKSIRLTLSDVKTAWLGYPKLNLSLNFISKDDKILKTELDYRDQESGLNYVHSF